MLIRQVIEVFDLLDRPHASGEAVKKYLNAKGDVEVSVNKICLLYTSPSPRDRQKSRMPSSA